MQYSLNNQKNVCVRSTNESILNVFLIKFSLKGFEFYKKENKQLVSQQLLILFL